MQVNPIPPEVEQELSFFISMHNAFGCTHHALLIPVRWAEFVVGHPSFLGVETRLADVEEIKLESW